MDESQKKQALRMVNYWLYVPTASDGNEVAAGTVNWVSQCSMKPPLVMVGVKVGGHLHSLIERTRSFALNFLGEDQKDMASEFFKPTEVHNGKLNGRSFVKGSTGSPMLTRGDHSVVIAEVVDASVRATVEPLFMRKTGWFYGG